MSYGEYEHCEECGAVLVLNKATGKIYCLLCGWSPSNRNKSDVGDPSYIG